MLPKSPYKSRKFLVACFQMIVTIFLPVAYKLLGISDDILMVALSTSTALSSIYIGFNAISGKKDGVAQ